MWMAGRRSVESERHYVALVEAATPVYLLGLPRREFRPLESACGVILIIKAQSGSFIAVKSIAIYLLCTKNFS